MFAILENKKIKKYPVDPKTENPNISFTENWSGGFVGNTEYVFVDAGVMPEYNIYKNVQEAQPKLVNGTWVSQWKEVDASPEEIDERFKSLRSRMRVFKFKLKAELYNRNYLENVETIISEEPNKIYQIIWQDSNEINRVSDISKLIQTKLNLSDAQMDDIFKAAALIET